MILFKKITDLRNWLDAQEKNGYRVGFTPTMGALHPGHLTLISSSKNNDDVTVCSIFVNPTQFNDPKDFEKYPITLDRDIEQLEMAGCDVLFLPAVTEIYPGGHPQSRHYDLGYLESLLDGKFRPGHFQGVCTVVERLLDIVQPANLYLGQKDYQQCLVIKRLVELMGRTDRIRINICPTLRESDGLAMSSRNMRLSENERHTASEIFKTLSAIKKDLQPGDLVSLKDKASKRLIAAGFKPDYIEIADAASLELLEAWDGRRKLVALAAAFLNEVRLIDNMLLN